MAHAQKPDLVFQRSGLVHLNRRGNQFSRLLAVEECGSAGRPWIDHVPRLSARVVATLSNRLFPLHFPSHTSPCAITFRTASTNCNCIFWRHVVLCKHCCMFVSVMQYVFAFSLHITDMLCALCMWWFVKDTVFACTCSVNTQTCDTCSRNLLCVWVVPNAHERAVKVKVKFTLELATKAQRGSRGIALHVL